MQGHRLSLLIFLPNRGTLLCDLEPKLLTALKNLDGHLQVNELSVAIPRVRVETVVDVVDNLRKMGIKDLLDGRVADLSLMSKQHGLHLAHFNHRSFFEFSQQETVDAGDYWIKSQLFESFVWFIRRRYRGHWNGFEFHCWSSVHLHHPGQWK